MRLVETLVPQPGIEPGPLAVQVQSPNHWTTREILTVCSSMVETENSHLCRCIRISLRVGPRLCCV